MNLLSAVKSGFRNYAVFSGRAPRAAFWKFALFILLALVAATVINSLIFGPEVRDTVTWSVNGSGDTNVHTARNVTYDGGWLSGLVMVAVLVPYLAVAWRRMHDTGRSGWWVFLPLPIMVVVYTALWFFSKEVPLDPAAFQQGLKLPEGFKPPTSVRVPDLSPWAFVTLFALSFGSAALVIFWLARASQPGPNRYGPNPLEVTP